MIEPFSFGHQTPIVDQPLNGEMVRSKSELIIANLLHVNSIEYVYELPLTLGGRTRYPDFTVDDSESGTVYYWEHCGMLNDPQYRLRWEKKQQWYRVNGVLPYQEGGGPHGTLIVTEDSVKGGISSVDMEAVIKQVIKS